MAEREIARPPAEAPSIERDDDRAEPRRGRAAHERFRELPVFGPIKLKVTRGIGSRGRDRLHRRRGGRGEDARYPELRGRAGDRDLTALESVYRKYAYLARWRQQLEERELALLTGE